MAQDVVQRLLKKQWHAHGRDDDNESNACPIWWPTSKERRKKNKGGCQFSSRPGIEKLLITEKRFCSLLNFWKKWESSFWNFFLFFMKGKKKLLILKRLLSLRRKHQRTLLMEIHYSGVRAREYGFVCACACACVWGCVYLYECVLGCVRVCVNDYKRQVERVESNWKDSLTVETSREKVTLQINFYQLFLSPGW